MAFEVTPELIQEVLINFTNRTRAKAIVRFVLFRYEGIGVILALRKTMIMRESLRNRGLIFALDVTVDPGTPLHPASSICHDGKPGPGISTSGIPELNMVFYRARHSGFTFG